MNCVLFVCALVALCISQSVSFSLNGGLKSSLRTRNVKQMDLQMINPVVAKLAAVPVMYTLMSVNEYVTHRWYQHAEIMKLKFYKMLNGPKIRGGGHVEHHAETLDDMSLRTDDAWIKSPASKMLNDDKFRGTAFTWAVTGYMTIQMLPSVIPIFTKVLGFSVQNTLLMLAPSMLLHALVWNCLHPAMHGLEDVGVKEGAPSSWLGRIKSSKYFEFIYKNHQGHHVVGGQGNYNVCCPMTDHLCGTYVPEAEWRPRMRPVIMQENAVVA